MFLGQSTGFITSGQNIRHPNIPEIHNVGKNIQALSYRPIDIQFYHIREQCQGKNELFLTFFYVGFYGHFGRCPK